MRARRMTESAALMVDEVLPHEPKRQWVLSFPFQLRFLFASRPELMGLVMMARKPSLADFIPSLSNQLIVFHTPMQLEIKNILLDFLATI